MVWAQRISFLFVTLFVIKVRVFAVAVSPATAENVAINFFRLNAKNINGHNPLTATLKYTQTETDGTIDFYVFNMTPTKGFVIVSADDQLMPVIAYSFESGFNAPTQKQGIQTWMNHAGTHIYQAIQRHATANTKISGQWSAYLQGVNPGSAKSNGVAPMLTTAWNQEPYYNQLCPYNTVDSQRTLTGCVATAMAQIMKYWNYPAQGTGSYGYLDAPPMFMFNYGNQYANFGATTYNWSAMPDYINSNNISIATLMYHCGVAVAMNYGDDNQGGSGAYVLSVEAAAWQPCAQKAYSNYFGYNANTINGVQEVNYSSAGWINLMEGELNAGRPIQYEGVDTNEGGHTWVCDGYDGNDFLHMNWGWGGLDNGYFNAGSLSADGYNFSNDEGALIGIQPMSDIAVNIIAADTNICRGNSTTLSVHGPVNVSYVWSPVTGLSCPTCAVTAASPDTTTIYTVTIDSAGITASGQVTITVNNIGIDSFRTVNATCYGTANGAAKVMVAGGDEGYTYLWNSGSINSSAINLAAGNYVVTVSNAIGCSASAAVNITQPDSLAAVIAEANAACFLNNASLNVSANGGTPSYTYAWSGGQKSSVISSLQPGVYSVTINDANGCTASSAITITQPTAVNVNIVSSNTACSLLYATLTANVTAGNPNFLFNWNNGKSTPSINNLSAGAYSVTVTDSLGCISSASLLLSQPDSMNVSIATNPGSNEVYGKAVANVTGGEPQYSFLWNTGDTTESIAYATTGLYAVTITDSKGCAQSASASVTETTGIAELNSGPEFEVFPNPATNQVTVQLDGAIVESATLEVKNILGQTLIITKTTGQQSQVDLSAVSNGVYFITLTQGSLNTIKQIVVKK